MGATRLFVPQEALDRWLEQGRVSLDGDAMTFHDDGRRFFLKTALRFEAEVTGAGDAHQLVGRVKDADQIAALGGEHVRDSVVLGDCAYQVVEGFACESLASSTQVADMEDVPLQGETGEDDLALLAKFLLEKKD